MEWRMRCACVGVKSGRYLGKMDLDSEAARIASTSDGSLSAHCALVSKRRRCASFSGLVAAMGASLDKSNTA
jgi:hypothetical protein